MTDANDPSWKTNPRCDEDQLAMLRRCSEAKDMTEWNDWRKANPREEIWLQGADLFEAHLEGADLSEAHLEGAALLRGHLEGAALLGGHLEEADLNGAHLEGARLFRAHLEGAHLWEAHLEGAKLDYAYLRGAYLRGARFEATNLSDARLEGAELTGAYLEGACLARTHLEGAVLVHAHLERARLLFAQLEGADLGWAHLEGAGLRGASVDDKTRFSGCSIDRKTNFEGVDLDLCDPHPSFVTAITHNLRESRWRSWYGEWPHWFYKWPVWLFWQMSDYGRSVGRIGLWFIALSVVFAAVYFTAAIADSPGIVNNLIADETGCVGSPAIGMWRALYFSIVTMTTLGFGDMHARVGSFWGHGLLMLQVVAGYFLLGVLVSRVTIAFQTVGPARPLAKPKGWWRRWRMKIIAAGVVLVLLALGRGLHGWAESKWPEVIEQARMVDGPSD